ncbi:MAG: winged helix DNA-binding domain-containing protein [Propionibacteriales bacterium]|nr:winged helix DNA-binding domain-containing protein [Propionibacteriales bacterium]
MVTSVSRAQVLSFRVRAQQLGRERGLLADTTVLDIGAQDTGPDGGLWALAIRGVDVTRLSDDELATVWTVRGAPHLYRREDLPTVAVEVAPFSDADAGKRIFDATKPLRSAGIGNIEALDAVAAAMRSVVGEPMVKGDVSTRVTALMGPPYLRFCRPCNATHLYEMPFRLSALRAGLELEAGTSPPVLRRIPHFNRAAQQLDRFDVIRAYLRLLGPATHKHVADYLDAPLRDVRARWPADVVEVTVDGEERWALAADVDQLTEKPEARPTRLLGPFDLFLQARDRQLLVDDPARSKVLWPVLGRPGAVLLAGEVAGTWRPRKSGSKLDVRIDVWTTATASAREVIADEAERLAASRGARLAKLDFTG